jgi:hypothetical protein
MNKLIEWKEPPRSYQRQWTEIADELRANPGRWALVAESYGNNIVYPLRNRGINTKCERVTSVPPHRYNIYARFEGTE